MTFELRCGPAVLWLTRLMVVGVWVVVGVWCSLYVWCLALWVCDWSCISHTSSLISSSNLFIYRWTLNGRSEQTVSFHYFIFLTSPWTMVSCVFTSMCYREVHRTSGCVCSQRWLLLVVQRVCWQRCSGDFSEYWRIQFRSLQCQVWKISMISCFFYSCFTMISSFACLNTYCATLIWKLAFFC